MADLPSTPADGNLKVVWVPAIANPDAPTVSELTAQTVVDLSCYLTADGWNPSADEQVISDDRLCDTETYEQPGRASRSLEVTYIDNTNTAKENEAVETLQPGTSGYLVTRSGVPFDTPIDAGDLVDVWPVTCGIYQKLPPEANSVLRRTQRMFVTSRVRVDVEVVSGS